MSNDFKPLLANPKILQKIELQLYNEQSYSPVDYIAEVVFKIFDAQNNLLFEKWNEDDPEEFILNDENLPQIFRLCLKETAKGQRCIYQIPMDLVTENFSQFIENFKQDIFIQVQLIDFFPQDSTKLDLNPQQRVDQARIFKTNGNNFFKEKKFQQAIQQYEQALDYIDWETLQEVPQMKIDINNNIALAHMHLQQYQKSIQHCNKSLELDKMNIKALLRKAKALRLLQNFEDSIQILQQAQKIHPQDKEIKSELNQSLLAKKKYNNKNKNMFQNAFSNQIYQKPLLNSNNNAIVFMDIKIGNLKSQRIEFELFKNIVPKTVYNFVQLCQGTKLNQKFLCYKNSKFHRLIKGFMIQGGKLQHEDSVYGGYFADENFDIKHDQRGLLSMANKGPNTNTTQFFILFDKAPHLDNNHVVFGKVTKNFELLEILENQIVDKTVPIKDIVIENCGVVKNQLNLQQNMPKTKKRAQSSYARQTLVPPTGSTFVNHGTCRPGVCNIGGYKDEKYFTNSHKKTHATFGKPRGKYTSGTNRNFCYQSLPHVDQRIKQKFKPQVPKISDQPIQGLSSNENFIKKNLQDAKRLQPKKLRNNFLYTKKQNYGKVPNYLNKIKENIQEEVDYIRKIKEQEEKKQQTKIQMSQEEILLIRQKLQQKYKEINKQYEKIAHLNRVDCLATRKKKIFWEKQLNQIEKDMKIMSKDTIYVDITC